MVDAADVAKAIVALANSGGGQVLLGVEDDGRVTGVGTRAQADALQLQISQVCQDRVHPPLTCRLTKAALDDEAHDVLVVDVPGFAPDRPYRAAKTYYVRDANRSREATRDELVRLLQSADHHFDEQPVVDATLDDLDLSAAAAFLERAYRKTFDARETRAYLQPLKAVVGGVPTVTGLLFFGHEPQRFLPDARVSAVRVPGVEPRLEFSDHKEIGGRLLDQLEGVEAFFDRHLTSARRVEDTERRITPALPATVLGEVLRNALTHRDYRAASQTRVFVYDNRVEVVNPGALLNQLTLDGIRLGGLSQRRNPVIASLLARVQQRENLGFGVPDVLRRLHEAHLPGPDFDLSGGHFRIVLHLGPAHP